MKTVFINVPMRKDLTKQKYQAPGNRKIEYDKEVYFSVNAVLAKRIRKDEEIKIIFIKSIGGDDNGENNIKIYKNEFDLINADIGAKAQSKIIEAPFETSKGSNETLMNLILDEINSGDELIADITYGPKTVPILILAAFTFAEKFMNARVTNLTYGKVEFKDKKIVNPQVCDVTSLYFINSFINTIEEIGAKKARETLNKLFSL